MLFHVAGGGNRPTYFEMVAADSLPSSIKSALLYSIGVFSQRFPRLHRLLDYGDEALVLFFLLLESHSLSSQDASFAEALYGLRRTPASAPSSTSASTSVATGAVFASNVPDATSGNGGISSRLSRKQRTLSLLLLVGLPYLRSKLHSTYTSQQERLSSGALWAGSGPGPGPTGVAWESGASEPGDWNAEPEDFPEPGSEARDGTEQPISLFSRTFGVWYPLVHGTYEGLSFVYQLLYLLDSSPYFSPALHCAALVVRRATADEMTSASSSLHQRRARLYSRLRGPAAAQALQRWTLKAIHFVLDYAQTSLIASVFLFKMLEWWYQSAEQRVTAPAIYPPPPPPPPPKPAPDGVPLPSDLRMCPLCLQERTNPATPSVSGYVFCYPCIFRYVEQYGRCPVTLAATTVDQIRRLYHNA